MLRKRPCGVDDLFHVVRLSGDSRAGHPQLGKALTPPCRPDVEDQGGYTQKNRLKTLMCPLTKIRSQPPLGPRVAHRALREPSGERCRNDECANARGLDAAGVE